MAAGVDEGGKLAATLVHMALRVVGGLRCGDDSCAGIALGIVGVSLFRVPSLRDSLISTNVLEHKYYFSFYFVCPRKVKVT